MKIQVQLPKHILLIVNNLYEIEKKISIHGDSGNISRNVTKMRESLEEEGVTYEDPQGQVFNQTRTDLEATIAGEGADNLIVVDVIKPIIRGNVSGMSHVIQKGIVVVETKKEGTVS